MAEPFYADNELKVYREEGSDHVLYRLEGKYLQQVDSVQDDVRRSGSRRIILDLSRLAAVNSHFIGFLAFAHAVHEKREISLIKPSRLLLDLLDITGIAAVIRVHAGKDAQDDMGNGVSGEA